ncbi:carbohydrate ABC transporter permease [Streptomyces sp. NPDC060011]|uniref:carbohydrate ABC transporter permease n=1 Tax=unclassified Streptomyces TaxID=2593676 RepID=UPI001944B229|nr:MULTISPECIES: carbohydrate ABC transporter permease [unclassified Streptomyces]MCX4918531.1 carbohydrate ABC transporter permease [Streptomyces sp. NBC_00687]MCX5135257.1 carbohydrate ABC transporter permease [Streptomyces sp. NBC_00340]MCX5280622.1 carbohydrate ABC transporter permease [Streptomyces sp. NBC_00198]WSD76186.1 carbohydrate ABC transporter permease [Streptomyces sp. NBC_01558]WSK59619.1 carbohydrate ABC transporter permease [Streptomyces sp. NBC_01281]
MSTLTHTTSPARPRTDPEPAAAPERRRRTSPGALLSKGVVNGLLIVAAFYTLMPVSWLLLAATKNPRDLFGTSGFALGDFNLFTNLHHVFTFNDGIYLRWFGNSVLYSVIGSAASTFLSVATGYAFDKYDFKGKEKLFAAVLAGVLVPTTVIQLPMYLLATKVGVVNTYWALLLPALVNPFGVYLARVFSEGYVPNEVLEAARVDGAGEVRTFAGIALPMLAPAFMTIFLFSFTASWNNFFGALVMLNDEKLYPVNLGLFMWNSVTQQQPEYYSLVITGSLVAVVPLIVAFVCLQRFWRSGLTAGAVK